MSLIRRPKDFYAGILFIVSGTAALLLSRSYPLGSASRMGAGYFPRILAFLLIGGGVLLSLLALRSTQKEDTKILWRWRPLVIILFSVCLFSWAVDFLGLVAISLVLVFVASSASSEFRWKDALISGLLLGLAAAALFVYGLGIPLPVWPVFAGGGL